ncbi:hypothetical protein TSOC_002722 [Tetrabaena socialis]|uniref:Glycosyltransferase family 92 protein n=1 Tax=Tetrabaena socialis TaxID=47790 RepID=A0A2J8ADF0_9CHLO|nr:hypothetical protein TSOC_002722 [Tetrabaena socialis]|eukprot:PNH10544.1 hypothetical protein TSOC_002722 [Tetrabaena socialis]
MLFSLDPKSGSGIIVVSIVISAVIIATIILMARSGDRMVIEKLLLNTASASIKKLIGQGGSQKDRRVAIVSMMRDPNDIHEWLNYHMLKGVTRFYIRLETVDASEDQVTQLLLSYPQVTLQIGDPTKTPGSESHDPPGQRQMLRQRAWVSEAIQMALKDGINWIVHIDSDELLECSGLVGDAINTDAMPDTHTMVLKNFEAVYGKDKVDVSKSKKDGGCFTSKKVVDCSTEPCASYANGKAVGRVTPFLQEAGVHRFHYSGPLTDNALEMQAMYLVHYESCDFPKYMDKFLKLAGSEVSSFPFPYYNDSIAVARGGACVKPTPACKDEFAAVYTKYRTTDES